jgi:hypothetical protein
MVVSRFSTSTCGDDSVQESDKILSIQTAMISCLERFFIEFILSWSLDIAADVVKPAAVNMARRFSVE